MRANNIDEVITYLEHIIRDCTFSNNRLGYFAALYHKVTVNVKQGIVTGKFQHPKRMERLDIIFANRYLEAYQLWQDGKKPTASWELAFITARKSTPLVLQQLLLGMSAHINLDLGIAAVEVMGDSPMTDLHSDFDMINTIIASLTYEVLNDLGKISPLLSLLGLHAGNRNSVLIQFSIDNARDGAWCFAEELHALPLSQRSGCITQRDQNIHKLGESIAIQSGFLRFTAWLVHMFEWKKPARIITALYYNKNKQYFVTDPAADGTGNN